MRAEVRDTGHTSKLNARMNMAEMEVVVQMERGGQIVCGSRLRVVGRVVG